MIVLESPSRAVSGGVCGDVCSYGRVVCVPRGSCMESLSKFLRAEYLFLCLLKRLKSIGSCSEGEK